MNPGNSDATRVPPGTSFRGGLQQPHLFHSAAAAPTLAAILYMLMTTPTH